MANRAAVYTSTCEIQRAKLPDELYPLWRRGVRQLFEFLEACDQSEKVSMGLTQQKEALPLSAVKR